MHLKNKIYCLSSVYIALLYVCAIVYKTMNVGKFKMHFFNESYKSFLC